MAPPTATETASGTAAPKEAPSSEGQCLCGAVTLTVQGIDFADGKSYGWICHCFSCRRSTGTDYAHHVQVPSEKLVIQGGEKLTQFEGKDRKTGEPFTRAFCSGCGSTITATPKTVDAGGEVVLRMGLFPHIPDPEREEYADEKLEWLKDKIPDF